MDYDVALEKSHDERFWMARVEYGASDDASTSLVLVLNWFEELKRLVPTEMLRKCWLYIGSRRVHIGLAWTEIEKQRPGLLSGFLSWRVRCTLEVASMDGSETLHLVEHNRNFSELVPSFYGLGEVRPGRFLN